MNDPMNDNTVILIILATILLIFITIFSSIPRQDSVNQQMQWRDSSNMLYNQVDKI